MATPTEWLEAFRVNKGAAASGAQAEPRIIGLSNGNFLVGWEDVENLFALDPGLDIVGKIYDAEGNVVQDSFRINTSRTANDEFDFDLAPTNDGGFILVYRSLNGDSSEIIWERKNSAGNTTNSVVIASEVTPADFIENPQVAVDLTDNTSIVTFTDNVGAIAGDIRGQRVSDTGTLLGIEFDAALNLASFSRNGDVAILSDGNYVSVYEEESGGIVSIGGFIFTPEGVSVANITVPSNGADPEVTSLADGNLVVTWENNEDIEYGVYSPTGTPVTGVLTAAGSANIENEPDVVALQDGDFVIVYDDDTFDRLFAQRFNPGGSPDSSRFTVANGNQTEPNIGVTGDGRILFTWISANVNADVFASIWDPRISPIIAGDYDISRTNFVRSTVVTSLTTASTVLGDSSNETILGQAGNDKLKGNDGKDTISGGAGRDTLIGGSGKDLLSGNKGKDKLKGGGGRDSLFGGKGKDRLFGGKRADKLVGGRGADQLIGSRGRDVFDFNSVADSRVGRSRRDTINDFAQVKDTINLKNIDAEVPVPGNQKFTFIGSASFSGAAGELRSKIVGNKTRILGDVTGDGAADLEILLKGAISLNAGDFVL